LGALPSMMATHEFVVPRSMPMILAMCLLKSPYAANRRIGLRGLKRRGPAVPDV
jgi:hypothetical protein